jgi:membrane protein implicated in regulation of membrane protease activity
MSRMNGSVDTGEGKPPMIILGLILLILGIVLGIGILYTIGIVLIVVGAVLWLLGSMDRAVGGRRHYW